MNVAWNVNAITAVVMTAAAKRPNNDCAAKRNSRLPSSIVESSYTRWTKLVDTDAKLNGAAHALTAGHLVPHDWPARFK